MFSHRSQEATDTHLPKKLRRLAMLSALSSKVAENELIVLDELKFDAPKTKEMVKVLENVKAEKESSDRYWLKRTKTSLSSAANISRESEQPSLRR